MFMNVSNQSLHEFSDYTDSVVDQLTLHPPITWNAEVKDVVVILSASRAGSSLVFNALAQTPGTIATSGEHEPWMLLSKNKYPFTDSDKVEEPNNLDLLLQLLREDMLIRSTEVASEEYELLLQHRLALRGHKIPGDVLMEVRGENHVSMTTHLHIARLLDRLEYRSLAQEISELTAGTAIYPIENPPFITHPLARRATDSELSTNTVLMKSPSDAYRPNLYPSLFPNAHIRYIHLTRGFAQAVNGLIDGWSLNEDAFASSGTGLFGTKLSIDGYNDSQSSENYWKFDQFPGWESVVDSDLLTVACLQWISANRAILRDYNADAIIPFEDFYAHPNAFVGQLEAIIGVSTDKLSWGEPVMATEAPRVQRWKKREEIFTNLSKHIASDTFAEIISVNEALGYSEDSQTWL